MAEDIIIRLIADAAVIPAVFVAGYALIFKIPKGQRYKAYCRILMAGLTAYLVAKIVSVIYQPALQRPFEVLGVEPGASYLNNPGFPSDHALFVAAIALAVWCEVKSKAIGMLLAALVILVSIGRVVALVHTPLDIIGGVAIAMLGAVWYIQKPQEVGGKRGDHGKSNTRGSSRHTAV